MDEDTYDAACAQQELEERARLEAESAKHKAFRRECDDFHRQFQAENDRIFGSGRQRKESEPCL